MIMLNTNAWALKNICYPFLSLVLTTIRLYFKLNFILPSKTGDSYYGEEDNKH